jgi:hypothetical protein
MSSCRTILDRGTDGFPMRLNELEIAVIEKLLAGDYDSLAVLRRQVQQTEVDRRELTGVGFFTYLSVTRCIGRLPQPSRIVLGDVQARIPGLKFGAGFLLYIVDGALQMLEGYTYDEQWPKLVDSFELEYDTGAARNLAELSSKFANDLRR